MSIWAAAVWLKNRLENYISENSEKWVYSGKTGTEKTLINNEEWLEEELNLPAETDDYDNNAYILDSLWRSSNYSFWNELWNDWKRLDF